MSAVTLLTLGQLRRRPAAFAGLAVALFLLVATTTLFGSLFATEATEPVAVRRTAVAGPGLMAIAGAFGDLQPRRDPPPAGAARAGAGGEIAVLVAFRPARERRMKAGPVPCASHPLPPTVSRRRDMSGPRGAVVTTPPPRRRGRALALITVLAAILLEEAAQEHLNKLFTVRMVLPAREPGAVTYPR
ncbi:hypothetical protein [Streptomyces sp. NPDC002825]|uniref:hypothetical protein n=1 Tax=Streptomyces sp. NPDC002825 TaxID=3154666 RepID=UPI003316B865